MKIHKEGFETIYLSGIIFAFIAYFSFSNQWFPKEYIYVLWGVIAVVYFFTIRFFRVPSRDFIQDDNAIICSADGQVVAIEDVDNDYFPNEKRKQVSVFMSPFNVHVNWYPIAGEITHAEHKKGKHYPAFLPKSSTHNEQSFIVIKKSEKQQVLLKQIAGSLARRIVFYSKAKQKVEQGGELGIIKFGSRVDLLLPFDVKVNVKIGQKVKAGLDIIAYFN